MRLRFFDDVAEPCDGSPKKAGLSAAVQECAMLVQVDARRTATCRSPPSSRRGPWAR